MTPTQRRFQKRLRALRVERKFSQWQAATLADISNTYYQELEAGKDPNPTLKVLENLAKGFGVGVAELLTSETATRTPKTPSSPSRPG